jgi:hypothetical protein
MQSAPEITREIYLHAIPEERRAGESVERLVLGPKLDPSSWGEPLRWHSFFRALPPAPREVQLCNGVVPRQAAFKGHSSTNGEQSGTTMQAGAT